MSLLNRELLQNIIDEADFILTYTASKNKDEISNDPVLSRAVVRSLEIIGEASRKVDSDFKTTHPEIEWKKMAGTRNRLIHDYQGIDYEIVSDIIKNKLPKLKQQIENLLSSP